MSILNLTVENRIAVLTIDQPGSTTNRISKAMMAEFRAFLDEAEQDESIRAVILHSTKTRASLPGRTSGCSWVLTSPAMPWRSAARATGC
jgi:enoyl-CoA hydratase/carnithine racemase